LKPARDFGSAHIMLIAGTKAFILAAACRHGQSRALRKPSFDPRVVIGIVRLAWRLRAAKRPFRTGSQFET
jgi:hypothetical protein